MGGAQYQAKILIERLLDLDLFDIHYLTRRARSDYRPNGYSIHVIRSGRRLAGTYFPDAPFLWRLLKTLRPDVIYQRVGCAYTGIAAYYARRSNCRMVWHVAHDTDVMPLAWQWSWKSPLKRIDKRFLEYGLYHADAVVVQTLQQGTLLKRHYGRDFTAHIPNFHPLPAQPTSKPDDRIIVCWIANIKARKQPELFVRLARDLADRPGVEFVMVGAPPSDHPSWGELQAKIASVSNLRYLGQQPQSAVNELLARAHVFVNTSKYEGFANTFVQAWMRRVPVVSLTFNPDGVFDNERYGICAGGSYDELRCAVERLCADAVLRQEMGERAARHARETFSETNVRQLVDVLQPPAHRMQQLAANSDATARVSRGLR